MVDAVLKLLLKSRAVQHRDGAIGEQGFGTAIRLDFFVVNQSNLGQPWMRRRGLLPLTLPRCIDLQGACVMFDVELIIDVALCFLPAEMNAEDFLLAPPIARM